MIVCAYCGGPHPWWDCRKKPDGWKPPTRIHEGPLPGSPGGKGMMAEDKRAGAPEAQGGQTTRPTGRKSAPATGPIARGGVVKSDAKPVSQAGAPTRPRGRPATGFDKAAYDRDYQRQRRAKLKEGK